jgi:hypothetical protein
MSITTIAETAGKDIEHVAEDVVGVGSDLLNLLTQAKQLAPAFKTELATLIADVEPIAAVLAPVIATGGENPLLDLAAVGPVLADLKKLIADFIAFLPTLELAIADVKADAVKPRHWA